MKGVPPPVLRIPARRGWRTLDHPKFWVAEPTDQGADQGSSHRDKKKHSKRRAKRLVPTTMDNFREVVQQYTVTHKKMKRGPDKSLSDDEQPDESGSVYDEEPPQTGCPPSPVLKEQIPQTQLRKLSEPFAGGTIESRVLSRSSSAHFFKNTTSQDQEGSENNFECSSRPLSLAIETERSLPSEPKISRFHATGSSSEYHSGGLDKDKQCRTTLNGPDVSDSSISELQWALKRKQAHLYVKAPLSSLPATGFRAEFFVELKFSGCTIYEQAWLGRQRIGSLRVIDFSHSNLKNLPDFSEAHQARSLILQGCKNLANVSCIKHLTKLEHLDLKGCTNLTGLPSLMHLKALSSIDLSHCRNLKRLPPSIGCLSSLTSLNLWNCKRLENLPISTLRVKSLQSLDISGCSNLMKRASAAGKEELCREVSGWEPEVYPERSSHSDEGASSSYTANPREVPCLERTHSRFLPRIEKKAMSPVNEEFVQTSATNSAATLSCQDFQEQMPALEFYMDMSVEAIHLADAFGDIEELVDSWFHQTSSLQKRAHLKDTICFLEELKGSIPRTVARMRSAQTCRTSVRERLTHVAVSFIETRGECSALDAQLTMLSDEEAKLDAEIQALISRKEEPSN